MSKVEIHLSSSYQKHCSATANLTATVLAHLLTQIAREAGLDANRLLECINAARPSSKIADDVHEAGQLGIQKTPTNIVVYGDKSAIVQGAVDGAGLMQMMAQLAGSGQK